MDSSLFTLHTSSGIIWLLVYVNDILITGNNTQLLNKFVLQLNNTFALKDLGSVSYFLGVEAVRTSQGLHLSQTAYINDLLARTKMENYKVSPSPASTSV